MQKGVTPETGGNIESPTDGNQVMSTVRGITAEAENHHGLIAD